MVTIREALLSVVGENADSIQPIVDALSELGFNEHEQAGSAFSLLEADQAAGLTVRQRLALKAAIQGVAAGLGVGSTTGAGGSTGVRDVGHQHNQQGAGLARQTAKLTQIIMGVTRLMHGTEPVGNACILKDSLTGRWVLVTARHCLSPQPGKPIGDLGLTAYNYKLQHVASYPKYDISVLAFVGSPHEDANLQRKAIPFELGGGMGLVQGWQMSAVGFPLAVDMDVPGAKSGADGVLLSGRISWLNWDLDLALCDFTGAVPNISGGAVVLSGGPTGVLVGVHLGAVWHREGEPLTGDDVRPEGNQTVEGAWGKGLQCNVMETNRWCETPHVAMLSTGSKKRHTSGSTSTSQYFVPAHTLCRLLRSALSTAGTAAGGVPAGLGVPKVA